MSRFRLLTSAACGRARSRRVLSGLAILLGASGLLVSGCGIDPGLKMSGSSPETQGATIKGVVHGGQQPVVGADVYLYAAGTSGYGTAAASLLVPGDGTGNGLVSSGGYVTTDGTGSFTITGDYTCPAAPGDQVFLLSKGGNPTGGGANPNLVLMAALGSCSSLSSTTYVVINEVTTVASAYGLAQFLSYTSGSIDTFPTSAPTKGTTPYIGIPTGGTGCTGAANWLSTGPSTCNYVGLRNAMLTVPNLVTLSTGNVPPLASNPDEPSAPATGKVPSYVATGIHFFNDSYVPSARINTLANILAQCVNTTGGTSGDGTNCGNLFLDLTPASTGIAPTDTLQAIWNLAQKPFLSGTTATNFFNLAGVNPAFAAGGTLSSQPNDWTIALGYTSGGFTNKIPSYATGDLDSSGIAIDQQGNIIATNINDGGQTGTGSIAVIDNHGVPISPNATATAFGGWQNSAINLPFTQPAVDINGDVYFGNYGDLSLAGITESSGTPLFHNTSVPADVDGSAPAGVALDPLGNIYFEGEPSTGGVAVGKFTSGGALASGFTTFDSPVGAAGYGGIALDPLGAPWSGTTGTVIVSTSAGDQQISASTGSLVHNFSGSNNYGVLSVASSGNVFGCSNASIYEDEPPSSFVLLSNDTNGCYAGGQYAPNAIDGLGHLWEPSLANGVTIGHLIEVNSTGAALSPANYGYQGVGGQGATVDGEPLIALVSNNPGQAESISGTAVDPSGNVWVLNGAADAVENVATHIFIEFVGLGAPTVTPVSLAVQYNTFTQLP